MNKKIYIIALLLVSAIMANAQQYPKVIGYENGQQVATPGNPNLSAVSFSGGTICHNLAVNYT